MAREYPYGILNVAPDQMGIRGKSIQISNDDGNILSIGSDDGLFVLPRVVDLYVNGFDTNDINWIVASQSVFPGVTGHPLLDMLVTVNPSPQPLLRFDRSTGTHIDDLFVGCQEILGSLDIVAYAEQATTNLGVKAVVELVENNSGRTIARGEETILFGPDITDDLKVAKGTMDKLICGLYMVGTTPRYIQEPVSIVLSSLGWSGTGNPIDDTVQTVVCVGKTFIQGFNKDLTKINY